MTMLMMISMTLVHNNSRSSSSRQCRGGGFKRERVRTTPSHEGREGDAQSQWHRLCNNSVQPVSLSSSQSVGYSSAPGAVAEEGNNKFVLLSFYWASSPLCSVVLLYCLEEANYTVDYGFK